MLLLVFPDAIAMQYYPTRIKKSSGNSPNRAGIFIVLNENPTRAVGSFSLSERYWRKD